MNYFAPFRGFSSGQSSFAGILEHIGLCEPHRSRPVPAFEHAPTQQRKFLNGDFVAVNQIEINVNDKRLCALVVVDAIEVIATNVCDLVKTHEREHHC